MSLKKNNYTEAPNGNSSETASGVAGVEATTTNPQSIDAAEQMTESQRWQERLKAAATGKELMTVTQHAWDAAVAVTKSWDWHKMTFADGSELKSGMVELLPKKTKSAKRQRVKSAKFNVTYKGVDYAGQDASVTKSEFWDATQSGSKQDISPRHRCRRSILSAAVAAYRRVCSGYAGGRLHDDARADRQYRIARSGGKRAEEGISRHRCGIGQFERVQRHID